MLRIEERVHPSGAVLGVFFMGSHEIGKASKKAAGWVPLGKRKPLSEELAAQAMIDALAKKAQDDLAHANRLREGLRRYCGGRLPSEETPKGGPQ